MDPPPQKSAWLPAFQAVQAGQLRLFCLAHAGGGASPFVSWRLTLAPAIVVQPVQLPGHQERLGESCYDRLLPLVDEMGQAIAPHVHVPFALFGHSMGGLLAWELARWLRRAGLPMPVCLFLAAAPDPVRPPPEPLLHLLSDDLLMKAVQVRFGGMADVLMENAEFAKVMLPVFRADFCMLETHRCASEPPLPCPIHVFGGGEDHAVPPAALAAWRPQTTGEFSLRLFAGGHFFVHDNPRPLLGAIRQKLQSHIHRDYVSQSAATLSGSETDRVSDVPLLPKLAEDEVHLWYSTLDQDALLVGEFGQLLDDDERQRAERLRPGPLRDRFVVSHARLRQLLGHYLACEPQQIRFVYGARGKPRFARPWDDSQIVFNMSHSHGLAIFGVARNCQLGVDVERIDPRRDMAGLVRRYFAVEEQRAWEELSGEARQLAFYQAWTRKEAWLKARGSGLAFPLDRFAVSLRPDEPPQILWIEGDPVAAGRWWLDSSEPVPGYVAAVVAERASATIRYGRWPV